MQKIILNHTNLVGEQSKDLESVLPIGGISNFTNKAIDDEEIDEELDEDEDELHEIDEDEE